MKEYVCTVCGYVHKGELPDDFVCPVCGAGKEAFVLKEDNDKTSKKVEKTINKTAELHLDTELSPLEISIICSNLSRGCEKQYLPEQAEAFKELADFFKSADKQETTSNIDDILKLIENDLSSSFVNANNEAEKSSDRGAKRALLWSEKVTNMLNSLLARYKKEGEKMLENTGVYVCTICGFVYIGDNPPERCPVCKVPAFKFEKIERGSN